MTKKIPSFLAIGIILILTIIVSILIIFKYQKIKESLNYYPLKIEKNNKKASETKESDFCKKITSESDKDYDDLLEAFNQYQPPKGYTKADTNENDICIIEKNENFAKGMIGKISAPEWYAKKINSAWKIMLITQDYPLCNIIKEFPKEYDGNGKCLYHDKSGQIQEKNTGNYKIYDNNKYGFNFEYPLDWKILEKDNTLYLYRSGKEYWIENSKTYPISLSFDFENYAGKKTMDEWINEKNSIQLGEKEIENITVGGKKAVRVKYYLGTSILILYDESRNYQIFVSMENFSDNDIDSENLVVYNNILETINFK